MPKSNRRKIILNISLVVFLTVSLFGVADFLAFNTNTGNSILARYSPDALINQRERAAARGQGPQCSGAGCLGPEILANRANQTDPVALNLLAQYDAAVAGDATALNYLKTNSGALYSQATGQIAQNQANELALLTSQCNADNGVTGNYVCSGSGLDEYKLSLRLEAKQVIARIESAPVGTYTNDQINQYLGQLQHYIDEKVVVDGKVLTQDDYKAAKAAADKIIALQSPATIPAAPPVEQQPAPAPPPAAIQPPAPSITDLTNAAVNDLNSSALLQLKALDQAAYQSALYQIESKALNNIDALNLLKSVDINAYNGAVKSRKVQQDLTDLKNATTSQERAVLLNEIYSFGGQYWPAGLQDEYVTRIDYNSCVEANGSSNCGGILSQIGDVKTPLLPAAEQPAAPAFNPANLVGTSGGGTTFGGQISNFFTGAYNFITGIPSGIPIPVGIGPIKLPSITINIPSFIKTIFPNFPTTVQVNQPATIPIANQPTQTAPSNLTDNSKQYTATVIDVSGQNILSSPDTSTVRSGSLLITTQAGQKITISIPNSGVPIPVADIKTFAAMIQKLGALGKYLPNSIIFSEQPSKNMTGPYAIDAPCTVTEGPCNVVLTIDSSKNSAAEIATAIGATLKFGNNNHGQYWYNDLQWAYYYTFFSGKGGSPGNYTAYDPKTMLPDQTPITGNSMTLAQDDMATSIARYLTDPATFKAQDPARYAFIDAVYKGYNPTDIQLVNNGQIVDTSKLDSTAIIQNIPTISATQQDTLMKMGWNNIPADIAANNAGPNDSWKNAVIAASQKYNVPISVIVGVMQIESGGQNGRLTLKGSSGEIGLMQITPDKTSFSKSELMTAQGNISAGAQFLRTLYDDPTLGNGNWRDTLALYNGGRYGWDGLINKPSLSQGAFNYADTVLKDGGVSTDQVKTNIPTSSTTTTLKTTAKAVPGPSQPNQPNVIAQTFNNVTSNAQRAILYPIKPFQNAINNIVDLATGDQTIQTLFYGGLAPQAGNSTVAITGTVQNINPQVPAQQPGTTQVTQIGNPSQTSQLQNFPIFLQYGYNDSLEINNYGGTLLKWGCGPSTAYNILKLEGYNVTFQKVLDTYLWTSIGSDGPSVLLDLRRNGFPPNTVEYGTDPNNIITDAKELANYNGLLVYSGKTNGKDHIAAFSCNQGDCYSIDSYFSQGNPIKCKIESTVRVNCGGVKYKVGESGGTPYAFYPVIQP